MLGVAHGTAGCRCQLLLVHDSLLLMPFVRRSGLSPCCGALLLDRHGAGSVPTLTLAWCPPASAAPCAVLCGGRRHGPHRQTGTPWRHVPAFLPTRLCATPRGET